MMRFRGLIPIGVVFVGVSMTLPAVAFGGVALGWNVGLALGYGVLCCLVLYGAGMVSRVYDEGSKP
jgi:hypothetical protein